MIPLYTKKEFNNSKFKDKLPCKCLQCENVFLVSKHQINRATKYNNSNIKIKFCSQKCSNINKNKKLIVKCLQCNVEFSKKMGEAKKHPKHFCSRSCACTYNNTHKKTGTRRSKLETYIEEQLTILYPDLHIDYNKKEAINSELDIYIPLFKLAIELNGIFHYEPIYGDEKLSKIKNNDQRKFQACIENKISLCIIDTSSFKNFKKDKADKFLKIISELINNEKALTNKC